LASTNKSALRTIPLLLNANAVLEGNLDYLQLGKLAFDDPGSPDVLACLQALYSPHRQLTGEFKEKEKEGWLYIKKLAALQAAYRSFLIFDKQRSSDKYHLYTSQEVFFKHFVKDATGSLPKDVADIVVGYAQIPYFARYHSCRFFQPESVDDKLQDVKYEILELLEKNTIKAEEVESVGKAIAEMDAALALKI
jgi:hypothetical protein